MSKLSIRRVMPLLATESEQEWEAFRSEIIDHFAPCNPIELIYCNDICRQQLHIARWQRGVTAGLNLAMRESLYELLVEQLSAYEPGQETASHLANWFTDPGIRQEISDVLAKYGLDESAIEAEAFRKFSANLMKADHLTASAELRRDRAVRNLEARRGRFGQQQRREVIDLTGHESVPHLEPNAWSSGG